jgi:hypothetical protein
MRMYQISERKQAVYEVSQTGSGGFEVSLLTRVNVVLVGPRGRARPHVRLRLKWYPLHPATEFDLFARENFTRISWVDGAQWPPSRDCVEPLRFVKCWEPDSGYY